MRMDYDAGKKTLKVCWRRYVGKKTSKLNTTHKISTVGWRFEKGDLSPSLIKDKKEKKNLVEGKKPANFIDKIRKNICTSL
jgi:hypothetical protein